jgi:TPR repeat protein
MTINKTNEKRIEKAKKEQRPPPPLLEHTCPFCRMELPENDQQIISRTQKRVEMGDPEAVLQLSFYYEDGVYGLSVDKRMFLELAQRAASLGSAAAHYHLGKINHFGVCGVSPDNETARAHLEAAAKSGHVNSRCVLGKMEYNKGNKSTAVRHWRISAAAGHKPSVDLLIRCFRKGFLSKESLEKSMRAKHEACAAIRSEDRDLALKKMIQEGEDVESYY